MMWIRSQNGRCLIKASHIRINGFDIEVLQSFGCTLIGKYSTKEKALKVIDLIQKQITNNETIYAHAISGSGVRDYNVFQMPEDDEVEDDE